MLRNVFLAFGVLLGALLVQADIDYQVTHQVLQITAQRSGVQFAAGPPLFNGGPGAYCNPSGLNSNLTCDNAGGVAMNNNLQAFNPIEVLPTATASPTPCAGVYPGATISAALCIDPPGSTVSTVPNGIVIGPNAASWTSGTGTSLNLQLCGINANVLNCTKVQEAANGTLVIGNGAGSVQMSANLAMAGNQATGISKITQFAVNDIWGSCAMSASTSCTITWTYAPTFCSAPNPVGTTVIDGVANIASTTITITAASANSATWDVTCQ